MRRVTPMLRARRDDQWAIAPVDGRQFVDGVRAAVLRQGSDVLHEYTIFPQPLHRLGRLRVRNDFGELCDA